MNTQVDRYLSHIETAVEAVAACLDTKQQAIQDHEAKHQELLQQYWERQQRLRALSATADDYEAVEAERQRLETAQHELRDRLTALLTLVKSLTEHLRQ